MATELINSLIPLDDNGIQIVIDKIAEILVNEVANQKHQAVNEGQDPDLYDARVFADRFAPLDQMKKNRTPLINIKESDDSTDLSGTATFGTNFKLLTIFIDCYGIGKAEQTDEGHLPADLDATRDSRRVTDLVRKILKADLNVNLQLDRKLVNSVNISSEQYFEPDFDSRQLGPVVVKRISLQCKVMDQAVINNGVPLDSIVIDIEKGDTGEIYSKLEYDYTT